LLWVRSQLLNNLLAPPGHIDRKKVTLMREVSCDARILASVPYKPMRGRWRVPGIPEPLELENTKEYLRLKETDFHPNVHYQ